MRLKLLLSSCRRPYGGLGGAPPRFPAPPRPPHGRACHQPLTPPPALTNEHARLARLA